MRAYVGIYFFIFLGCISVLAFSFQSEYDLSRIDTSDMLIHSNISTVGVDSTALYAGIGEIVQEAIDSGAFPGCQILLAKDGKIFFQESYGYHTYEENRAVKNSDLYDLASITKVTASTLALMKMHDDGKFELDKDLSEYFPYFKHSNKKDLSVRKVLAHQAGLKNWIPYYVRSQKRNGRFRTRTISADSSAKYPYKLSETGLWLHKDYKKKKIDRMIRKSKLYEEEGYVYSGLSFYLWPDLVEEVYGQKFDRFLYDTFYNPMGTKTLRFLPTQKFSLDQIVPTEVDTFFRKQVLHGVVHDEGAAMMNGISGNAGLFSNSYDLAVTFQMLINGGTYAGRRYLSDSTIAEFTRCQYCEKDNRRGLGFDKPLVEYDSVKSSVAKAASPNSFGHSGYTGTLAWADPDNDLIFIFLANRVYPTRENRKIYTMNVRPRIHNLVYDLLENSELPKQKSSEG